jgi:RHS repeat-associated protein
VELPEADTDTAQALTVQAEATGEVPGLGAVTMAEAKVVWAAAKETVFSYDRDGNMLRDHRWNYVWNGENRLVEMRTRPEVVAPEAERRRLTFDYDGGGRRWRKRVYNWVDGDWALAKQRLYLYDGWNLCAEIGGAGELVKTYVWGLDLSGTMQGAGGVGGLLAVVDHGAKTEHWAGMDGYGNVVAWWEASAGRLVERRQYSPFGELLEGGDVVDCDVGWSTKTTDSETGLVYYGFRYYSVEMGRWLNRDPIEEDGGWNIYVFVENDPVLRFDLLGLQGNRPRKRETNLPSFGLSLETGVEVSGSIPVGYGFYVGGSGSISRASPK